MAGGRSGSPRSGGAVKIVVIGPLAAGKSTMIGAVSEIDPKQVGTSEVLESGRIEVDQALVLDLFGAPGEDRFDFMWEILAEGMLGFVLLVDAQRADSLAEAVSILRAFRLMARVPFIVALNRADRLDHAGETRIRQVLGIGAEVPVVPCDATERESVKSVLLALLYCVADSLDRTPARA